MLKLSMTSKCHRSECHACNQLELLQGPADFCDEWVVEEQLHQLGFLKNDRRTQIKDVVSAPSGSSQVESEVFREQRRLKQKRSGTGSFKVREVQRLQQLFKWKRLSIAWLLLNKTTRNGLGRTGCSNLRKSSCQMRQRWSGSTDSITRHCCLHQGQTI
jgi:hypothetical protein